MRSFNEYASARSSLMGRCDRLAGFWNQIRAFASETDELSLSEGDELRGDVVDDALSQVRNRLQSSTVEIGVFGEVNRGKSTLLNALLRQEVSSMWVTPNTAVPVWVEPGSGHAVVVHNDGRLESVEDPAAARERMTQRHRLKRPDESIARVVQYVDAPWLTEGIRIIDTPGLGDPSLAEEYEELTMAELDRVAAAVFVFVSPPGIGVHEVRLLRTLGERGIDKAFLVCNFYKEHWESAEDREDIRDHIASTVAAGAAEGGSGAFLGDDVHVFQVNARRGLEAALEGDQTAFQDSGVQDLLDHLERHLAEGVLQRMTARCEGLLARARAAATDVVQQRLEILTDRGRLERARSEHQHAVSLARSVLDDIKGECAETIAGLQTSLAELIARPFQVAEEEVGKVQRAGDLERVNSKLRLSSETAASLAATTYSRQVAVLEERVRRRLYESYGVDERIRARDGSGAGIGGRPYEFGLEPVAGASDWDAVALSAGVTAVAGAVVGGSLAGGLGIALLATGPIGWLVGAGIGLLAGGLLGAAGAKVATSGSIDSAARSKLLQTLAQQRGSASENVRATCASLERDLIDDLERQQDLFFGQQRAELQRVERIIADEHRRKQAIADASTLLEQLRSA